MIKCFQIVFKNSTRIIVLCTVRLKKDHQLCYLNKPYATISLTCEG